MSDNERRTMCWVEFVLYAIPVLVIFVACAAGWRFVVDIDARLSRVEELVESINGRIPDVDGRIPR